MKIKSFLPLFLVAPFVIAQLVIAPLAVGFLMLRGILLYKPRRNPALKYAMTNKTA